VKLPACWRARITLYLFVALFLLLSVPRSRQSRSTREEEARRRMMMMMRRIRRGDGSTRHDQDLTRYAVP
jgi:hypothetical protein